MIWNVDNVYTTEMMYELGILFDNLLITSNLSAAYMIMYVPFHLCDCTVWTYQDCVCINVEERPFPFSISTLVLVSVISFCLQYVMLYEVLRIKVIERKYWAKMSNKMFEVNVSTSKLSGRSLRRSLGIASLLALYCAPIWITPDKIDFMFAII